MPPASAISNGWPYCCRHLQFQRFYHENNEKRSEEKIEAGAGLVALKVQVKEAMKEECHDGGGGAGVARNTNLNTTKGVTESVCSRTPCKCWVIGAENSF